MIYSKFGLPIRFLKANILITITSIIGIILSVSLIVSMTLFSLNAKQTLKNEVTKMYGKMDISVGYENDSEKFIDKSFLTALKSNDNIEQVSSVLISQLTLDTGASKADFYTVGVKNDDLSKSRYHFKENLEENEIIVNEGLAEALGKETGSNLEVEERSFKLVETLEDLNSTGLTPDILLVSHHRLQEIMSDKYNQDIEATYLLIKAKEDVEKLSLANEIKEIDKDLRIEIAEEDPFLKSNFESLNIFIIVLSFLIIIVTSLLIISNFEVFLYKYKNQFAIMRSIGATTKQLFLIVLVQSFFITVTGSILGLCISIFSNNYLHEWLEKIFSFTTSNIDFNFKLAWLITLICMLIIQLFLVVPAIRITKVLPLKVIQDNEESNFKTFKYNRFFGKLFLVSSLIIMVLGKFLASEEDNQVMSILLSAILLVAGIFILFPIYLSPILMRLAPLIKKCLGNASYIAIKNIIPQVKKNTFVILTISALMIIAVFGSIMLNTIQKNEEKYLKEQFPTSIVLKSRLGLNSTVNPIEIQTEAERITGIDKSSSISTKAGAEMIREHQNISFDYTLGDLHNMEEQGLIPVLQYDGDKIIAISEEFAKKYNLKAGDIVEIGKYSEKEQRVSSSGNYKIGAIVTKIKESDVYIDWNEDEYRSNFIVFHKLYVEGRNVDQVVEELEQLRMHFPEIQINSYEESLKKSKDMFYQRWSIFIVVISVMLISVIVGVFNTLINNINSKRKEFAILRTISLSKSGIINVILTQIILYLLIGLSLGLFTGVLLTIVISLIDPGKLYINFTIIGLMAGIMILMAFVIFIPFASRLGNKKIILELNQDSK
ncbi:ABC transporter permease [Sporosarcina sp. PTS2304]|uniref:FtsX-like permease family protein n=1 Tax=Sporosarcina sp. PTS2304 TaxID=2283194 RepID=UPI000E0DE3F3|nr:ABC transporter permease [Sporosarcina sp. PTS2304]AXI00536.1 ABC transporter permease [Sporosarcina sp. PTS2304]